MSNLAKFNSTITNVRTQEYLTQVLGEKKNAFVNNVTALVANNKALQECEPLSIMYAATKATALDLLLDQNVGFAYVIPYKNNKEGITEAQFQIGYRGFIQLAMRSGQFKTINVRDVREGEIVGEDFLSGELQFKKLPDEERENAKVVGYVAYFRLINGFEKMSYWTVQALKNHGLRYSQTYASKNDWVRKNSKWETDFDAMAKKGLALDTLIPTPSGFTTIGELKVGDIIYNALGKETKVIAKSEIKHLPCYKITYQNGDSIVCDNEHRWFANGASIRKSKDEWNVIDSETLFNIKRLGYPVVVPRTKAVEMKEQELPIRPYHLGYWLGNGSSNTSTVSCDAKDAEEIMKQFSDDYNVSLSQYKRNNAVEIHITSKTGKRLDDSSFNWRLRNLGVLGNKHIPQIYLRSSIEQRIDLLRGLCDSDGCIDNVRGRVKFGSVREDIVQDVYSLLCSLGEHPSLRSRMAKGFGKIVEYFEVEWLPFTNPFILKRKADRFKGRIVENINDSIKSIEEVESVPTQCIAVDYGNATDDADFRFSYLVGRGFHVTHNTVLKLLLSKYAPLSVDMQSAIKFDQAIIGENDSVRYVDNNSQANINAEQQQAAAERIKEALNANAVDAEIQAVDEETGELF